jgi:hypothetical protein
VGKEKSAVSSGHAMYESSRCVPLALNSSILSALHKPVNPLTCSLGELQFLGSLTRMPKIPAPIVRSSLSFIRWSAYVSSIEFVAAWIHCRPAGCGWSLWLFPIGNEM